MEGLARQDKLVGHASPPRTGSVEVSRRANGTTCYRARIRLADGTRTRVDVPEKYGRAAGGKSGEGRAELYALALQEREDETGELLAAKRKRADPGGSETSDGWHARYLVYCKGRGVTTIGDKGYRWGKWISPVIGSRPIAEVTRDEVEAVRNVLDGVILDGRLAWKTAANVWAELTATFAESCSSKLRSLQVRNDNPASGVQPPERGGEKSKVYPYPSEFLAVASCEDIPLAWREIHAIAVFTFLRPGELWVLNWNDVDLGDERIDVTKAWDFKSTKIKPTKTGETRSIPIETNLLPLLRRMHDAAGGQGLVVPLLSQSNPDKLAIITRAHFELANCKRPRLLRQSKSERHVVFRSWRDAGCTWSIVRGDDVVKVQRRAGHRIIATTMRYVVEAENRGATFGTPFPVLPTALTGTPKIDPGGTIGSGQRLGQIPMPSAKCSQVHAFFRTEGGTRTQSRILQNQLIKRAFVPTWARQIRTAPRTGADRARQA